MAAPDFLGIGAQKAGTSWLAENLAKHPEIWIPPFHEIHYFDEIEASPGLEFPELFDRKHPHANTRFVRISELLERPEAMADGETAKWCLQWLFQKRTDEWYLSLFDYPHHARIAGEITPEYSLLTERTVSAIRSMNPRMKIIFAIRNPLYRCWSHVAMVFHRFMQVSLADAPEEDVVSFIRGGNVVIRNDYVGIAARWKRIFGEDQLFMFSYEQIARDPHALILDVCTFLGVSAFPDALAGGLGGKVNVGTYTDFPLKYKRLIAELTIDYTRNCAETFGGDCVAWLEEAEAVLSLGRP